MPTPALSPSRAHAHPCGTGGDRWGLLAGEGGLGVGEHSALESQSPCPRGDSGENRCLPLTLASLPRAPERAP